VATSAIAVLGGEALSRVVPPSWLKRGAGVLFVILGVVFLLGWGEGGDGEQVEAPPPVSEARP
jgi:putative Ca2+/H+ antiporter (TMEM165/GDT1 family)